MITHTRTQGKRKWPNPPDTVRLRDDPDVGNTRQEHLKQLWLICVLWEKCVTCMSRWGERHQRDGYCNRKTEMLEAKNKNTVMKSQGKNW